MAKTKLLTIAVLSSTLVLASCAGKTKTEDTGSATSTAATPVEVVELEIDDTIDLVVEDVTPVAVIEEAADDMYNELLELTLVYFDFDKSSIRAEFVEMLDAHAAFLIANPTQMVVLEGHADERGTREYNLGLGELRAKQVATFLQIKGVSAGQIDTVSYGEEKPLAIGKSEAEYSQNRRVEIIYK